MHITDQQAEKLLKSVVHDLRQPLGNIETSAYLLHRTLRAMEGQANPHLTMIERQVDLAVRILNDAVNALYRTPNQPTAAESLDFTKSETAAVT